MQHPARMAELVDARDLKSLGLWLYEFDPRSGYQIIIQQSSLESFNPVNLQNLRGFSCFCVQCCPVSTIDNRVFYRVQSRVRLINKQIPGFVLYPVREVTCCVDCNSSQKRQGKRKGL